MIHFYGERVATYIACALGFALGTAIGYGLLVAAYRLGS